MAKKRWDDGSWWRLDRRGTARLAVALALVLTAGATLALLAQDADDYRSTPYLRIDPERTLVSRADARQPCGECHTQEWEVWRGTAHAQGFDDMHRSPGARDIMQQMGARTTKRQEALCMRCHYTVGSNHRAVAGVSCESCHGPARDWIDIHNRAGQQPGEAAQETPEQRRQRIHTSAEAGMLSPSVGIYGVAANCFECHTVPAEELVNQGGHSTGTSGFELVERVDQIRHNFLPRDGETGQLANGNRPLSDERKRILFVVGRMLSYEFALRGMAESTASGRYASAMNRRVTSAYRDLESVAQVQEIPEVVELLQLGADLEIMPDNRTGLARAAERIRELGQGFADRADGAALGDLDLLVAGERPVPAPVTATPDEDADPVAPSPPGEEPAPAVEEEAAPPELPGQIRRRPAWFPEPGQYGIEGAGRCGGCHAGAEEWWFDDAHQRAGRRLFGEDPRAREIAELYGIGAQGMARPDQICLGCHGTVDPLSGALLEDGVSCESCHGPGSGYLEPHEEGGNPQLGMRALKQAEDRVRTCAGCHHISDQRLLAAGHPSGSDYSVADANRRIAHWPGRRPDRGREQRGEPGYQAVGDGALQSAFAGVVQARPIPQVEVVARAPRRPARPAAEPQDAAVSPRPERGASVAPRPPTSRPPRETPTGVGLELEPLPPATEDLTTEELLLLVKRRLEQIYAALGRVN